MHSRTHACFRVIFFGVACRVCSCACLLLDFIMFVLIVRRHHCDCCTRHRVHACACVGVVCVRCVCATSSMFVANAGATAGDVPSRLQHQYVVAVRKSVRVRACVRACMRACMRACVHTCVRASCVRACVVHPCVRACVRACVCVRVRVRACVRAYVHACVHTCVCRVFVCVSPVAAPYHLSLSTSQCACVRACVVLGACGDCVRGWVWVCLLFLFFMDLPRPSWSMCTSRTAAGPSEACLLFPGRYLVWQMVIVIQASSSNSMRP